MYFLGLKWQESLFISQKERKVVIEGAIVRRNTVGSLHNAIQNFVRHSSLSILFITAFDTKIYSTSSNLLKSDIPTCIKRSIIKIS